MNENGLFNSDNVIAAPGVTNGAHHFRDYIGNQANNAFASDEDLARAGTSCADDGDKSSYYWPVLRLQNGEQEQDAAAPGGGIEGNAGEIVTPKDVTLNFVGNPRGDVTAMPRLLRIITGDAKAFVNGTANANASWSCTGFEDRQLRDKYPLCPDGSDVVRTFRFQSCWDGRNTDSANHRTHMAFAAPDGTCPEGFRAVPQLVQRIVYDVDRPGVEDGGRGAPLFAVDSFPEQLHKPVTDHGDFINVFDEDLMREMVDCINEGRACGPDAAPGEPGEGEETAPQPTQDPQAPGTPTDTPTAAPGAPAPTAGEPQGGEGDGDAGDGAVPGDGRGQNDGAGEDDGAGQGDEQSVGAGERAPEPSEPAGRTGIPLDATAAPTDRAVPRVATTPPATARTDVTAASSPVGGGSDTGDGGGTDAVAQTGPRAQGALAETGAGIGPWPAAAGGILLAAGCVLLLRTRCRTM